MQHNPTANPPVLEQRAGPSRLMSRLYREVGLAAVAAEFGIPATAFERDVAEAIERGASAMASLRRVRAA